MSAPLTTAVREDARRKLEAELAVRLTHSRDAILRQVPDLYRRIVGEALAAEQGDLGKAAQMRAAQRALDRVARIGVVDFVDQSGRRWTMQAYIEMAVRTGALRAMVDAQKSVYRERGILLVYVTNVAGQCKLCAPWESQLLSVGPLSTVPASAPVRLVDGGTAEQHIAGTIDEAIAAGLMHPNCRHRLVAFRPDHTAIPAPTPDPEAYEAQQHLRYLERQVRAWRRRQAAAITPDAERATASKVAEWQAAAREHVAATGTRRLYGREQPTRALPSPVPRRRQDSPQVAQQQLATPPRKTPRPAQARPQPEPQRPTQPPEPVAPPKLASRPAATQAELVNNYAATVKPASTVADRRAVNTYTGVNYRVINGLMRGLPIAADEADYDLDKARAQINTMLRLAEQWRTPAPTTVHRWVNDGVVPEDAEPGLIMTPRGFTSTSMSGVVPRGLVKRRTVMVIDLPEGMNGIVPDGLGVGVEGENELILPPDVSYRVDSVEVKDGKRWVRMTAIPKL